MTHERSAHKSHLQKNTIIPINIAHALCVGHFQHRLPSGKICFSKDSSGCLLLPQGSCRSTFNKLGDAPLWTMCPGPGSEQTSHTQAKHVLYTPDVSQLTGIVQARTVCCLHTWCTSCRMSRFHQQPHLEWWASASRSSRRLSHSQLAFPCCSRMSWPPGLHTAAICCTTCYSQQQAFDNDVNWPPGLPFAANCCSVKGMALSNCGSMQRVALSGIGTGKVAGVAMLQQGQVSVWLARGRQLLQHTGFWQTLMPQGFECVCNMCHM